MIKWYNEKNKGVALPQSVWSITKARCSQREPMAAFVTRAITRELLREGIAVDHLPVPPDPKPAPAWQGDAIDSCVVRAGEAAEEMKRADAAKERERLEQERIDAVLSAEINDRLRNA